MPYRICKSLEIENGHMLSKHPDKCRFPHGHSRKVEFVIEADELDMHRGDEQRALTARAAAR
jgi:6-pyruvoyltetrahydropterin/6-carboxytetrahydropterin synthase